MAQATSLSTTSAARFHNHAEPALAHAIVPPPTRRAFINTIAALSIAAAAPSATAHTIDADLIELGARFEPLVDQYYVTRKRWAPLMTAAHAEYRAMVPDHAEYRGDFDRRYQVMHDCCERSGESEARAAMDAIRQKMEELANAINAAPVNSIAGLRAKALVAFSEVAPKHAYDTEFSFERTCAFQQLFTAVAELCGLKDKMAAVDYQLPDVTMVDDDDIGGCEIDAPYPTHHGLIRSSNVSAGD
jgi:hypothetical protein